MANEAPRSRPSSRVVSELVGLAVRTMQVYPTVLQTGVEYWAKWLDVGLGYYGTTARQWTRAVQESEKRPEHVQSMIDGLKETLVSLAQVPGQAVLRLNQRFEELLREPVVDSTGAAPRRPQLALQVREDLDRLRRWATSEGVRIELPTDGRIEAALLQLETAERQVLQAQRDVSGAVERALQAARKLSAELAQREEPPLDVLRRLAGRLEQIAASVPRTE